MKLPWSALAWKTLAAGLFFEVISSIAWIGRILSFAVVYDVAVFVMVGLRAAVTALQMAAAARLWKGTASGRSLGTPAFVSSALLIVLEIGFGLSPSSTVPGLEWLIVGSYAAYAAVAVVLLRFSNPDK